MHFCNVCGNMFYLKIKDDDKDNIMYYCRKCGNKDDNIINNLQNFCVSKTHIKKTTEVYKNIINKYTKLDPTLPRIRNMLCPNEACNSNGEQKDGEQKDGEQKDGEQKDGEQKYPEIIYLRYDNDNMKYIYLCGVCDYTWKNN
jgi:DNA-directed RNA polymerase subunit M/transcription elongation factor TFIIS